MILFVRDLTVIDFSYLCTERGMLGESYIVDVELHGKLDEISMVLDFSLVKKTIKHAIDQLVDHKLAIPTLASGVELDVTEQGTRLKFNSKRGQINMAAPAEAIASIAAKTIVPNSITAFLMQHIMPLMPANVEKLVFTLRPEAISGFYYHYSHGLKKHQGNCQRIAHGHRSTIQIYADGMLSPRLNKYWSERWQDIYLGSTEDVCTPEQLKMINPELDSDICFRYQAEQGPFELTMPKVHCEIMNTDTTVECLAEYIVAELKKIDASKTYKVIAYEGVGKGAIAETV
ncbi:6-carboxytetrahydropterin synthase [Rheinheimera sp. WS51]|uniref:6-carboxytetrahydropterin synthase n=1 Tax=Rheinheimera sp. WS51 TaxID=3425886 RepID=UPI003D8B8E61